MRAYELLFILKPDLDDETSADIKGRILKIINDFNGRFESEVNGWGKKRLAYSIEDYTEGVYYVWNFQGMPETILELDRVIKLSDKFLRHLVIRLDDK